jgi:VanZ family protein
MNRRWLWLLPVAWAGLLFYLSAQSKLPDFGPKFAAKDKVEHAIAYAVLSALVVIPLRRAHWLPWPQTLVVAVLIASTYGALDEWHQSFVPGRDCSAWDWLADTAGGSCGIFVSYAYESHRSAKANRQTP